MPARPVDLESRFATGYSVVPFVGCWMWMGRLTHEDYPVLGGRNGRNVLAHRYSYEKSVGPIDDGMVMDHLCRNRWCVNPAHLEQVSNIENVMRGNSLPARNSRKIACKHGHDLSIGSPNVRISPEGWRECRACDRIGARERSRRNRIR